LSPKTNDRGRQSDRPSAAAALTLSVALPSVNSPKTAPRSRSTGILRSARVLSEPSRTPTCSTPTLVTLQDSFKKRMTYKAQESVAMSKEV